MKIVTWHKGESGFYVSTCKRFSICPKINGRGYVAKDTWEGNAATFYTVKECKAWADIEINR